MEQRDKYKITIFILSFSLVYLTFSNLHTRVYIKSSFIVSSRDYNPGSGSLEELKLFSSRELAAVVISICKLIQVYQGRLDASQMKHVDKCLSPITNNINSTSLYSQKARKRISYCTNTKSGGTFIGRVLANKIRGPISMTREFTVVREPLHRLLSVYPDKFAFCRPDICPSWKLVIQHIDIFITLKEKQNSPVYNMSLDLITHSNITNISRFYWLHNIWVSSKRRPHSCSSGIRLTRLLIGRSGTGSL